MGIYLIGPLLTGRPDPGDQAVTGGYDGSSNKCTPKIFSCDIRPPGDGR